MTQRPSNRHAHSEQNDGIVEANHVISIGGNRGEGSVNNIENNIASLNADSRQPSYPNGKRFPLRKAKPRLLSFRGLKTILE